MKNRLKQFQPLQEELEQFRMTDSLRKTAFEERNKSQTALTECEKEKELLKRELKLETSRRKEEEEKEKKR